MHLRKVWIAAALALSFAGAGTPAHATKVKNVVIVHGAFADGSGWRKVSDLLSAQGYNVSLVQEPLTSLHDDVAATRRVLALQDGPAVLVGHSYGGMVVSDAGNDEKVVALVFVAAFQPEKGESLLKLADSKPDPKQQNFIKATSDEFLYLDPKGFRSTFGADIPEKEAEFLARSQVFAAKVAVTAEASEPAWKSKPSWALVASEDRAINPDLERDMAKRAKSKLREVRSGHAVYLSKPDVVAATIIEAAEAVSK